MSDALSSPAGSPVLATLLGLESLSNSPNLMSKAFRGSVLNIYWNGIEVLTTNIRSTWIMWSHKEDMKMIFLILSIMLIANPCFFRLEFNHSFLHIFSSDV